MKTVRIRALLLFIGLAFLWMPIYAQQGLPQDFENWVENARKDWKIPGMTIAIVKDGEVILAKGYGEKKLGSGEKVDENTIFGIASVSKNMTAAALAILADKGKINWDDRIIDHIPWFRMKDPFITQEITIRDALIHRVGLGRILGNRLQFMTHSPRDTVLHKVRYFDLEKPFRSGFVYSNVMYSLAGQVIEYTDGQTWDDFLKTRLFQPLNMSSASTRISDLNNFNNLAYPHQEIDGKVVLIDRRNWDNAGPAGGVNASANDMIQWMLFQLGTPGEYNGRQLISPRQMNEIHKPQNLRSGANAGRPQISYGLGWNITDYKGTRVLNHGGATDGFNTALYLAPELDLGIFVSANTFTSLGNAIANQVIDFYLDKTDRDWHQVYFDSYQNQYERASKERQKIHDQRVKSTKTSLPLKDYTGIYESPAYGKVEVLLSGKNLQLRFWDSNDLTATLEHWHFDTFRAVWKNKAMREEFMQFHLDKNGKVGSLDFEFVLRHMLLQVGAYPSNYTHTEVFERVSR